MESSRILSYFNMDDRLLSLEQAPIIVNARPLETEEDRKGLENLILTRYEGDDVLATTPTCACRKYTQAKDEGIICDRCGTRVESHHSQSINSDLWISVPHGIEWFLAPLPWIFLSRVLTSKSYSVLNWAMDPTLPDPESSNRKATEIVKRFRRVDYRRGMRYLKEEFPKLMEVTKKSTNDSMVRQDLDSFFDTYGDKVFVKHVPVPSKVAFAVEGTVYGNYYDETMEQMIDSIMSSAATFTERDVKRLESRFTKVMSNMTSYYQNVISDRLSSKSGWFRRVNSGSRMFFSYRGIATSLHDLHAYDETYLPYHQMVTMLEPILKGRLIRDHGWSDKASTEYLFTHATDKDPMLYEMIEAIIDETPPVPESIADNVTQWDVDLGRVTVKPRKSTLRTRERKGGGIFTLITRYPSLRRGSTTLRRVVGISDNEIQMSIMALRGLNLDFDGDQLTGTLALDLNMRERFELLAAHYDMHDTVKPCSLRNDIGLPTTNCSQICNWMADEVMVI